MQNQFDETPHLTTALTGPLHLLEKNILRHQATIEEWLQSEWKKTPAPIYGSVDLRNAGFKLAPVDMNLFPAGFNNLNPAFLPLCIEAFKVALNQAAPNANKILLLPESHTRNLFYWDNVGALKHMMENAGYTVRVGTLLPEFAEPGEIQSRDGSKITIESFTRVGSQIKLRDFTPDVILLNNDLSDGIPDILKNLSQPMLPPAELGWSQRLKSGHFKHYENVCREFSEIIDIDPWLIAPLFRHCGKVDFMQREGEECLKRDVEELFNELKRKYAEYEINCPPYIVIKADAGTYGMAVMMVKSPEEVQQLNRKQRTAMSKSKGGQPVTSVIIQEGVYTFETWGQENAVAEPVVYMLGQRVVGGFYRVHKDRGVDENLNSPGMHFEPLAFVKPCHEPCDERNKKHTNECQNRFYAYGVIARLSMLAAAREMKEQAP